MSWGGLKFTKMSAGGNDFVVIDNITSLDDPVRPDAALIRKICSRALSVGADGVIVLEPARAAQVKMIYHNADGGRAALCGNGVRCVARMVAVRRWGRPESMKIETDVGILEAAVEGETARFRLPLGTPRCESRTLILEGSLDECSREIGCTKVEAGVPHVIVETGDAHGMVQERFLSLARRVRSHGDFAPDGVNVDYVTVRGEQSVDIRCFERGVEAETLSSGSGCIAAAIALTRGGRAASPVTFTSRAGIKSTVELVEEADGVTATLSGDARIIYTAVLNREALEGFEA